MESSLTTPSCCIAISSEALQKPRAHSSGESGVLRLQFSSFCQPPHLHLLFALRMSGECELYRICSDCQSAGCCVNAVHKPNAQLLLRIQLQYEPNPIGVIGNVAEDCWSAR